MKKLLFLILFAGLSASAADSLYAIVKGTNVIAVWQFDAARPPRVLTNAPFAGSTNIAITEAEHVVIQKGWSFAGGVFRDQNRLPLSAEVTVKKERESKAKNFKAIYEERKKNWDTIKVSEQADVLGQLCALIDMIVTLHPELLEPKPE